MDIWAEAGGCDGEVAYGVAAAQAVAQAGAQALKVQWLRPETIFSKDAPRYDHTSGEWADQAGGYKRVIYPYDRWEPVIATCRANFIDFIPAVFEEAAVNAADHMGIGHVKIASGDITNERLVRYAAGAKNISHMTISTGASTMSEVESAVRWVQEEGPATGITLLACHLEYPSPVSSASLGRIIALQSAWPNLAVGYSDHTPGLDTVPLALILGAEVLEKHFTLHPGVGGGDHDFAVDREELGDMVRIGQYVNAMVGDIELEPSPGEWAARSGARRSLYARVDIGRGTVLTDDLIVPLRPYIEGAVGAEDWSSVVEFKEHKGLCAMVDILAGDVLTWKTVGSVGATLTVE